MSKETECPTVSSPILQREKATRLFADNEAGDDQMEQLLEKLKSMLCRLIQRMDKFAEKHGYA